MIDTGNAFIAIHVFSFGSSGRHQLLADQVGRSNLWEIYSEMQRARSFLTHLPNN